MSNEITVNGVVYIPKYEENSSMEKNFEGLPYVIVRTYSAGAHAGYLKSRKGKECTLINARRLWYWNGAASLSQLAVDGTSKPNECKFPAEVQLIQLTEAIEIINTTELSRLSIESVPVWKA